MQKIHELIKKLCPNGVEYKNIQELCKISRGKVMSKDFIKSNAGEYPVYSSQTENNGELGKISTYDFDGEYLTWTTDGANAGSVFYRKGKFSVTNVCGLLEIKNKVMIPKFLYYVLSLEAPKYVNAGMGNPKLMSNVMAKIRVAVPPLEVQCEIVHVLDDFTLLSAELSAELKAREKQYEFYRKELLNNKNTKLYQLKDIIKKSCSGGTPLKSKLDYYQNGTIPWLRTQDVRFNEIYEATSFITEIAVQETSAKWIPENCVIVAISGASAGRCAINKFRTTTNQHCLNIEIDNSKALYKYVFYCVCSKYDELISMKQGARGDLNASKILSLKIPMPSIDEQEKIVNVLERFDKLCNDISEGLPAEIEARQKQYEYYRDKLLTFKELKVNE